MARKQPSSVHSAFLKAARDGDFEGVRHYFEEGASLESRDDKGRTAVHIAAERGFNRTIDILAELGADINAQDRNLETPLHIAARQNHGVDMSSLLIVHGADVTIRNRGGDTPFTLVKKESRLKDVLRGAWLAALEKNPPDYSPVTDHDIIVSKPLNVKRRNAPPAQ
jgi:ankyrin repeat protein